MISLSNVTKRFRGVRAVDGLSWNIEPGQVVGLLGPNGAGKTTTMRMITGFYEPDEGSINIDAISHNAEPLSIRKKLGYLPENNPLYEDMSVSEYLDFVARLKLIPSSERSQEIKRAVLETGLESVYYKPISELSKGYKQRVGLAQAILGHPPLLILDEPTEGLDPNQRVEIRNLIRKLGTEHTVILSTHVMQEVEATCDRMIILNKGKKIAEGTPAELLRQAHGKRIVSVELIGSGDIIPTLERIPGVESVSQTSHEGSRWELAVFAGTAEDIRPLIFNTAKDSGWTLLELRQQKANLEDVFHELTK